jgi:hypothetical protein
MIKTVTVKIMNLLLRVFGLCVLPLYLSAQTNNYTTIRVEVNFDNVLRPWDGFGFNYVEEAQSRDLDTFRQEYGGFSFLDKKAKNEILNMVFGDDGLKPGIVKMFLDPWHQLEPGGPYNHEYSAGNMLEFVRDGYKVARKSGRDFQIITTLYGPPGYMTKQKVLRGRELDFNHKNDLADYFINWAKFLIERENLPLKYISFHNEGDDWQRWPVDGGDNENWLHHDYNMHWPPELVVDFLKIMPKKLKSAGLGDVGLTPGECYGWDRFVDYGYASAICADLEALDNMAIITSHGFHNPGQGQWKWGKWNPYHTSVGTDMIRNLRPEMRAWVVSTSWKSMDTEFIREIYGNIYNSKTNAIIPWAGIQRPGLWVKGDPNSGCAFNVLDDGTYLVRKGYYFYKQVSRAGQPGMGVAETIAMDGETKIIAFAANHSDNPDAFVVINMGRQAKNLNIKVAGSKSYRFDAFRSLDDEEELYHGIGEFKMVDNTILYEAPGKSVTTFFGFK